jgi:hypothetical protein
MLAILYDLSLLTFYEIMLREKLEDTKGVIRGRNWKDNTVHKKKNKKANNGRQNTMRELNQVSQK